MGRTLRVIGPGRAGGSLERCLVDAGWSAGAALRRGDAVERAAEGVDLLLITTPDGAVAEVAAAVAPVPGTVVAHASGALGLDVLEPHGRRASVHPLVAMPSAEVGAERLPGAWFAIAGDPLAGEVVDALRGHRIQVDDADRAAYHAAAVIASNHLVALLGQAERVAATAGVPLEAYLDLVRATVDNVAGLGPRAALTGPAARGDEATIEAHLAALHPDERAAYGALASEARRLAGRDG